MQRNHAMRIPTLHNTRILSVFRLLKQVGFACLLLVLNRDLFAQLSIRWSADFCPRAITVPWDIAQLNEGNVVVGSCRDSAESHRVYPFVSLVANGGELEALRQYDLGQKCAFENVVVSPSQSRIYIGGQRDTYDGTERNAIIMALNRNGDSLWHFIVEQEEERNWFTKSLILTGAGGLSAVVSRTVPGELGSSGLYLELDSSGTEISRFSFGEQYGQFIETVAHFERSDGYIVVAGNIYRIRNPLLDPTIFALCISNLGDTLWSREYQLGENQLYLTSVIQMEDDSYVLGGRSIGNESGPILVYCDSQGDTIWTKTSFALPSGFSGEKLHKTNSADEFYSLHSYPQGALFDATELKLFDISGVLIAEQRWTISSDTGAASAYSIANDTTIRLAGSITTTDGNLCGNLLSIEDAIRLDAGHDVWAMSETVSGISVFPNPFNSSTHITLTLPPHIHHAELLVHNLLGQEVMLRELNAENGQAEFALDGTNLATGVYLVSARAGKRIVTQKVMLLK